MGAAFNNLMEEETKESLAKMCCDLMDEIAVLKCDRTIVVTRPFEFLDERFLALMNDIGCIGHEKLGADAVELNDGSRRIPRHQKVEIMAHAHRHLWAYENGVKHDKLGTLQGHLAATAFNAMLEYIFSQGK